MSNEEKYVIKLIRHGESLKVFPGSDKLTYEGMEWLRPISEEAATAAEREGHEFGKAVGRHLFQQHINGNNPRVIGVHSGRKRSEQTLRSIIKGFEEGVDYEMLDGCDDGPNSTALFPVKDIISITEDFDLGYLLDERYVEAAKNAVKKGDYPATTDFFINNTPIEFFDIKHHSKIYPRTYSAKEMQENIRGVLRRNIERAIYFENANLGIMVSHEPVLSLSMVDLTEKSITELGGKFKELEAATFHIVKDKSIKFPITILELRGQQYDITEKICTGPHVISASKYDF
ncbi:hypothetical protein COV19_04030 [Candidatus Woesearchaeota archaeon CG10_big_fil_rev_8_21_14_0_10_44_13]|nr:MAG: hypothetical protein COV19_04030 [Candidatus Woesearchaeota archaeon CG10_big_fil_rev_8_21_14_0_10_44_13]